MAIVTIAAPLSGIRGKLGGIVYSANRSGPFARAMNHQVLRGSMGQLEQRGLLAQAGVLWRTLTTEQQDDWNTFAESPPEDDYNSLGELYLPSGFNWFSRIFVRRRRCGLADDLEAPAATPTDPPDTFTLDLAPATGESDEAVFGYTEDDFETYYAILEMSIAPGLGTNVWSSRFILQYEALQVGATSTEFGLKYFESFGVTQVGQRFYARLYRQSATGIRSTPLSLFADVAV